MNIPHHICIQPEQCFINANSILRYFGLIKSIERVTLLLLLCEERRERRERREREKRKREKREERREKREEREEKKSQRTKIKKFFFFKKQTKFILSSLRV